MKRTLWTFAIVLILGIGASSCETASDLDEVITLDETTDSVDDKEDEKDKPGGQ